MLGLGDGLGNEGGGDEGGDSFGLGGVSGWWAGGSRGKWGLEGLYCGCEVVGERRPVSLGDMRGGN